MRTDARLAHKMINIMFKHRRHAGLREGARPRPWTRAGPTAQDQRDERLKANYERGNGRPTNMVKVIVDDTVKVLSGVD